LGKVQCILTLIHVYVKVIKIAQQYFRTFILFGYDSVYRTCWKYKNLKLVDKHSFISKISPLALWVRILLSQGVSDSTLFDQVWSEVFSGLLHQLNWLSWYHWNIVESGVKHNNPNPICDGLICKISFAGDTLPK
jgi:hypothetical protein